MPENAVRRRRILFVLLSITGGVVISLVFFSLVQHPTPSGREILGKSVPPEHPAGPCYNCHKGMAKGREIQAKAAPAGHPREACAQCHEGYAHENTDPPRRVRAER